MSDACFHNFDFNRMIYKAISTDDLPSALANLVVKTPFPAFFACLFKSSFTPSEDSAILCELFGQSFANRFLQNRDFFSTHRNSIPYTRGILGRDPFDQNFRKFWYKIKWNRTFLEIRFENSGQPPEVVLFSGNLKIPEISCSIWHFYPVRIDPSSFSREKLQDGGE